MSEINPGYEDEIELIDIFRILWKWRYMIIAGTLFFVVGAFFYGMQKPEIFRVEMSIQPGILKVNESGERVYINSLKDIKGRIEAGVYDHSIISGIWYDKEDERPDKLDFENEISTDTNVLKISYETQKLKDGSEILNTLFALISKEETDLLAGVIENYNNRIMLNNFELDKSRILIQSYEKNEKEISKRIREARIDIEKMNANNSYLSYERKKLLDKNNGTTDSLSALLYSNTIQQSIQFVNVVKKDLNEYYRLKEEENQKIIIEKDKQRKIAQVNKNLVKERDTIKRVKVLIPPENSSKKPVKPNKRLIVFLSFAAGLFFWVFLAFILEYLKNNALAGSE